MCCIIQIARHRCSKEEGAEKLHIKENQLGMMAQNVTEGVRDEIKCIIVLS